MSGCYKGVCTRIEKENELAKYTLVQPTASICVVVMLLSAARTW